MTQNDTALWRVAELFAPHATKPGKKDRFNLQKQKNFLDAFNFAAGPENAKNTLFRLLPHVLPQLAPHFSPPVFDRLTLRAAPLITIDATF